VDRLFTNLVRALRDAHPTTEELPQPPKKKKTKKKKKKKCIIF